LGIPSLSRRGEVKYKFLEPSAGTGAIAKRIKARLSSARIDCVEIDPFNRATLKSEGFNLIGDDFMALPVTTLYDFIVANPPFQGNVYREHIMKMMRHLKAYGTLAAIAPAVGVTNGTKPSDWEFRNYIAERGYWSNIGSPFPTTPVECVSIHMDNLTPAQLKERWAPTENGYASRFHESIDIALSCDRRWSDFEAWLEESRPDDAVEKTLEKADELVTDLIQKKGYCLLWGASVKQQYVAGVLNDLELPLSLSIYALT
jgi:hypothetical protein